MKQKNVIITVLAIVAIGVIIFIIYRLRKPQNPYSDKADFLPGGVTPANIWPLKKGSRGNVVKDVQSRINKAGQDLNLSFAPLTLDGDYGSKTRTAVIAVENAINASPSLKAAFPGLVANGEVSQTEFNDLKRMYP
jgi:hypothetical protein